MIELRERAKQEAAELGPVPRNPREHEIWVEERRGVIVLLAEVVLEDGSALLVCPKGFGLTTLGIQNRRSRGPGPPVPKDGSVRLTTTRCPKTRAPERAARSSQARGRSTDR